MTRIVSQLYDTPGGRLILDMTDRVQAPRFATNERGWHDWSGFIPMTPGEAFRYYDLTAGHVVISFGSVLLYQGRVEDPKVNGDPSQGPVGLDLVAFGYSQAYSDVPYTALWSTKRLDIWEPVTVDQQSSRAPERYAMSTDLALRISANPGESFDSGHIGSLTFAIPHGSSRQLVTVSFSYEQRLPSSAWLCSLSRFSNGFTFLSTVWTQAGNGAVQTGSQSLTILACDRLMFNLYHNVARTTLGAATNDVSTTLGTTTTDVNTTLGTTVAAPGVVVVTPASMTGIVTGRTLLIGGTVEEAVTVTATTATTFTATFAATHNPSDPVTLGTNAVTVTPASMVGITVGDVLDIGGSKPEAVTVTAVAPTTFTADFVNAHASTDPVQLVGLVKRTPASMTGIAPGVQLAIGNNGGATRSQPEVVTALTTTATTFTAEYQYPHHASDTVSIVFAGETDSCYLKISNLQIKTTTSSTVDAGEIARALMTYVDAANPTQVNLTSAEVGSPGLSRKEAWWEDAYPADILDELCLKGDGTQRWTWNVFELQSLRLHAVGAGGQTWYVDEAPALLRSIDGIWNEAYATYQDVSGRTKRTAVATDAGSLATFGLRRRAVVNAQTTDATEAALIRDTSIADTRYNGSLGEFAVAALRTVDGAVVPGWQCRAGDTIIVRGYPAGSAGSIDYVRSFTVFGTDFAYGQPGDRRALGSLRIISTRLPASLPALLARKG